MERDGRSCHHRRFQVALDESQQSNVLTAPPASKGPYIASAIIERMKEAAVQYVALCMYSVESTSCAGHALTTLTVLDNRRPDWRVMRLLKNGDWPSGLAIDRGVTFFL